MAGGVDDVDLVVAPEAGGGGGGDGDAALLFLLHPVHGGLPVIDLADAVALACIKEDPFDGGGFTRVDMGHNADITQC